MSLLAINHHYYREVSPPGGIYPINRMKLNAEVNLLRRHRRPLDQYGLLTALADPEEIHRCNGKFILTFDDGLKEQMAALHDLNRWGIAAIFFVPTAPIVEKRVLDVHKLHLIRTVLRDAELLNNLEKLYPFALKNLDDASAVAQYRYDDESARRVKFLLNFVLLPDERQDWIDKVFAKAVGAEADVVKVLYMNHEEIRFLGKKNMLGTHAHNHLPLAQLNYEEIIQDVALSMDILTNISNEAIRGISFPYGGPGAVNDSVVKACSALDLSYGFTMKRGYNEVSDFCEPFQLKRIDCNDVSDFI